MEGYVEAQNLEQRLSSLVKRLVVSDRQDLYWYITMLIGELFANLVWDENDLVANAFYSVYLLVE